MMSCREAGGSHEQRSNYGIGLRWMLSDECSGVRYVGRCLGDRNAGCDFVLKLKQCSMAKRLLLNRVVLRRYC
jgi:hypothetical protein